MDIQLNNFLERVAAVEEVTHTFYLNLSDWIDDTETKKVIKAISEEELRHRDYFLSLQRFEGDVLVLPDEHSSLAYLSKVPSMLLYRHLKVREALDFAINFEEKAILFYKMLADFQPEGSIHEVLNEIIVEEQGHRKIFEQLNRILS
jgi:rubrerythrin